VTRGSSGGSLGGARVVLACAVLCCLVVAGAGAVTADAQSEESTTNVSASVDAAQQQNARVSALAGHADDTIVQYLAGIGLGAGVGLCIGGIAMYKRQSRRIEDTFE
jgi:ABC-type nitrate/sulfonate/bicarbonate transport system permease component